MSKTPPAENYRAGRCNYIYACSVLADGSFPWGPENWTVEKTATGKYVITHNIGHTRYVPLPICNAPDYKTNANIQAFDASTITVMTYPNQVAADYAFLLLVLMAQ
jgi:hypothetical protein